MSANGNASADRRRELSVWDAISLIVGIVIGSTIFKAPALIFGSVPDATTGLLLWGLGGVLSFLGAVCYAELGAAYPRDGGEYVYLTRAYGRFVGFLYGWCQLSVVQIASIGALAYVFGDYAARSIGQGHEAAVWLAAGAVATLTGLNLIGFTVGKTAQNTLTITKLVGLTALVAVGLFGPASEAAEPVETTVRTLQPLAMILILYAYGGWNDAAFIVAEIHNPQRNVPRALLGGLGLVTLFYLLINLAYVRGLGFEALTQTGEPAAELFARTWGEAGQRIMSCFVMICALGGVNGLIFTVARVHATVGRDHPLLGWLGTWNLNRGVPFRSLVLQGTLTVLLIVTVGFEAGRSVLDRLAMLVEGGPLPWDRYGDGFSTLVSASAPVFWLFFLLNGLAVIVQRFRDPTQPRPFRVPGYPIPPLLFAATSGFMLYSSTNYARPLLPFVVIPVLAGIPLYGISQWLKQRQPVHADVNRET